MAKFFFSLLFLFLITSCGTKNQSPDKIIEEKLSITESLNAEITAIEQEITTNAQTASSLRYSKENGESVVVAAYFDPSGNILKIEEFFTQKNNGSNGLKSFYLRNNKPFATKEYFADNSNAKAPKFVDRISYYDENEKIIQTIEKKVDFEEDLDNTEYVVVPPVSCSINRAQQVLNQEGEFETTFQGFVHVDVLSYLVVGEPKPNGYTSALRADYEDGMLKELLKNEKKHLNRKIRVEFNTITDPSGFEYQVYLGAKFVE
jgi:hypothetical protein